MFDTWNLLAWSKPAFNDFICDTMRFSNVIFKLTDRPFSSILKTDLNCFRWIFRQAGLGILIG